MTNDRLTRYHVTGDSSDARLGGFALRVLVAIALVAGALLVWRMHDVLLLVFAAILVAVILHAVSAGYSRSAMDLRSRSGGCLSSRCSRASACCSARNSAGNCRT